MKNINLNNLLETLNKEGKKKTLEIFEIENKDWSKFMKDNSIEYDNKLKQYMILIGKDVQALLLNEEEIEINKVVEVKDDSKVTDSKDNENKTIDICDFINKKDIQKSRAKNLLISNLKVLKIKEKNYP